MRVLDEPLLAEFRAATRCSWCGRSTPGGCDPHHLRSRGMGGGYRLDVRLNLVSLCRACHQEHHAGHRPLYVDLLALVAAREGVQQGDVERVVTELRNAPKPLV